MAAPPLPNAVDTHANVYNSEFKSLDERVRKELGSSTPLNKNYQTTVYVSQTPSDVLKNYRLKLEGEGFFTKVENENKLWISTKPFPTGGLLEKTDPDSFIFGAVGGVAATVIGSYVLRKPPV